MNISGYYPESINEGEGVRAVIYISGCRHFCKGCFNPKTWNFNYGEEFNEAKQEQIIDDLIGNPLLQGLTLCGGDPFFSARELIPFIQKVRERASWLNIWSYTGFTFDEILLDSTMLELLSLIDVLIDGKFVQEEKDLSLLFRGSSNQKIVDVPSSLKAGHAIDYNK